ncbi:hypothetical protein ATO3_11490 [Marinibacterium profundimaris]|uniref:Gcp-like domain-containing protein n=1 Tax=Marinibacterium profundimaris TaxID=1679460 RepID=A0A225NIP3_9RHOB|nr:hypothetical protein ATO3_11490 [Marinibacterium profundimaris]
MLLAFDTSGPHVSAALLRGGDVVAECHEPMTRGQAERLVPALQELMAGAGIGWDQLDAIGVGIGPGNFTGIRICVATARGLALGLGIPAVGVSTLEAAALDAPRPVVATAAAARDGAFFQLFDGTTPGTPDLMPADEDGTGLDHVARRFGPEMPLPSFDLPGPRAAHGQVEAIARIAARRCTDPALPRPAPLYIRPADAAPSRDVPPVLLD